MSGTLRGGASLGGTAGASGLGGGRGGAFDGGRRFFGGGGGDRGEWARSGVSRCNPTRPGAPPVPTEFVELGTRDENGRIFYSKAELMRYSGLTDRWGFPFRRCRGSARDRCRDGDGAGGGG